MKTMKIEWMDKTWNPVTWCTKVSAGCVNCYVEVVSRRPQAMEQDKYKNGFYLTLHKDALSESLEWKKPHVIFVCSMSDLFHKDVPNEFINQVINIIKSIHRHKYQTLTKRAERMAEYFSTHSIPDNVWLGVTVENQVARKRIDFLRTLKAPIRSLSCEPLGEDLGEMNLENIEWSIVGGESGTSVRPMRQEWVLSIQKQTEKQGSAFFFRQWGTWGSDGVKHNKRKNEKMINGKIYQEVSTINCDNSSLFN